MFYNGQQACDEVGNDFTRVPFQNCSCWGSEESWPGLPQLYQHLFSIKGNIIASTFCFHSLQNFKDIRLFLEGRNVTKMCK